ncbi:MAG: decarboxylase, partial [Gemmatimonadetes bacterium]|nr:decarboxylase [Gemmatimonadota bacterium]
MVDRVAARVIDHIASLPSQPASYTEDGRAGARALAESLPEQGTNLDLLLDLLFERAVPLSYNTAGPG